METPLKQLHIVSPLLLSNPLSELVGRHVYLKLENVQPCNSFKVRGISRLCQKKAQQGCRGFVTFSGGNAGIALAWTASLLKLPCHVVVPSFVSKRILDKIRTLGAQVTIVETARDATNHAFEIVKKDSTLALVHPYDDPELWPGIAEMVREIKGQLNGEKPSCIVASVGGGGMLTGILMGLEDQGWPDVPVVAMETDGAHSLNKSIAAGQIVENLLTSIAKTLGAPAVTPKLMELLPKFKVISQVLSDKEAVSACFRFADDHAFLVEPACGVTLATVYSKLLPNLLTERGQDDNGGPIVLIVCGGCDTSVGILQEFAVQVGLKSK